MKKQCNHCHQLYDISLKHCPYCYDKYKEKSKGKDKERYKEYNKKRYEEDKEYIKFYNSKQWKQLKTYIFSKVGIDLWEYYEHNNIVSTSASGNTLVCHHIIPVSEYPTESLNPDNIIPLTESNHRLIHLLYSRDPETKKKTQDKLRKYLKMWQQEMENEF